MVGPVYIEPKNNPGNYDREVFLTLKEFEPTFSRGGDMAMDFLSPATTTVKELKDSGENAMNASLAKGMPHGFEVGYGSFTINGRMLGSGEPIRVKQGERVLFHILNGSATEIRSLALPGHTFTVVAMDGNVIPKPVTVPGLWLGTAERVSAIVEMNHPAFGSWAIRRTTTGSMVWVLWLNMPARRVSRSGSLPSRSAGTTPSSEIRGPRLHSRIKSLT